MSLCLQFDEHGEQLHLATNKGWSDVQRWADSLSVAKYPKLLQFIEYGISEKRGDVFAELTDALVNYGPKDLTVLSTLHGLLHGLNDHKGAEVILVTNGAEPIDPAKELGVDDDLRSEVIEISPDSKLAQHYKDSGNR